MSIGRNGHSGHEIDVVSIRTMVGLCYKLKFSFDIPIGLDSKNFGLEIRSLTDGIDKLTKFKWTIASENTWQGIIYGKWPYSNSPPIINAALIPGLSSFYLIELEENIWKYINGETNFDSCMGESEEESCLSIFDARSMNMESRYLPNKYRVFHCEVSYFEVFLHNLSFL